MSANRQLTPSREAVASRGFTVVEVLVTLAVVGTLLALAAPAVQMLRERSRRTVCAAHLSQLGHAAAQYHDAHGCYLPGGARYRYLDAAGECRNGVMHSPFVAALPFLGEAVLYDSANFGVHLYADPHNRTFIGAVVAVYVCPSEHLPMRSTDFSPFNTPLGRTSYAWCESSGGTLAPTDGNCAFAPAELAKRDGMFNTLTLRAGDVADGLSATMFAAEHAYSTQVEAGKANNDASAGLPCAWTAPDVPCTLFTAAQPPRPWRRFDFESQVDGIRLWFNVTAGATSCHAAGVNVLFGDGAVRMVGYGIESWSINHFQAVFGPLPERGVWQRLATRGGGDGPSGDF